ncbi:MAG: AAA family ATPase, partial [Ruminococcus sp.]|nr:AAA family ATPase [Ruminococcus sp.]
MTHSFPLSAEQQRFISIAQTGRNVLVDACIGSGKTTAIQRLCDELPKSKRILYLTYNRLLKIDARSRIVSANTAVTNYHGFAYGTLKRIGITPGISDLIQAFIAAKPPFPPYEVLIIDEYQDIEQEFADMLEIIKAASPQIQIIAVGDMQQKIYDKTTLNAADFIHRFLGDYERLTFTKCFRLSRDHAAMLGRIWKKPIVGVNQSCVVEEMNLSQAEEFLSEQDPRDILCLGSRNGSLSDTLNELESKYPDRYNKNTVYASISEGDNTKPGPETAIVTTFDSSKGLERKICVVFDFTESYWQVRLRQPQQSYEILRNIFCVAASRGKEHIIFAHSGEALLSEDTLSHSGSDNTLLSDMDIGDMFHFKYREDIEECYERLTVSPMTRQNLAVIHTNTSDGLIDLAPCIGLYQKAVFFSGYDIEKDIELK